MRKTTYVVYTVMGKTGHTGECHGYLMNSYSPSYLLRVKTGHTGECHGYLMNSYSPLYLLRGRHGP